MTRSGIFGATALSLSLAMAAPALAQQAPGGRAGAHVSGGAAMRGGNVSGARMGGAPQANFRGAQPGARANVGASNFAARGNAQFAQRGANRGGEFRGDRDRRFGRDVGIAAGVAAGSALAYGGYGYDYGYGPDYYGDSYAYDDGSYYDPGYAVAFDQPVVGVDQPVAIDQPVVADASYCAQRYRSYDPASGTYLGFDGLRHPCP
jgi:BA14K-like protein